MSPSIDSILNHEDNDIFGKKNSLKRKRVVKVAQFKGIQRPYIRLTNHTANMYSGRAVEKHFFAVILKKNTRISLLF